MCRELQRMQSYQNIMKVDALDSLPPLETKGALLHPYHLNCELYINMGFPGDTVVKNLPANVGNARDMIRSLDQEDPLEEEMATHSSILAQKIPGTEEAGRLYSPWFAKSRTCLSD